MALMNIIKARHSIRKYTDKQISREDLGHINGEQPYSKPRKPGRIVLVDWAL